MAGEASLVLIRDASRPGPTTFANTFATWTTFVQMIEQAPWLPKGPNQFIRSALTADVMRGLGQDAAASALQPPRLGQPQLSISLATYASLPPLETALTALVVVGATVDIAQGNDGFQARVDLNVQVRG